MESNHDIPSPHQGGRGAGARANGALGRRRWGYRYVDLTQEFKTPSFRPRRPCGPMEQNIHTAPTRLLLIVIALSPLVRERSPTSFHPE
jgi:hypothetical protein